MMRDALAESMALTRRLTVDSQPIGGSGDSDVHVSVAVPDMGDASETSFLEGGSRYNWTKTQFAGARVHAAVCAVLRYVKQRYATDLEVTDDSDYFVDEDYEKLEAQLAYVDRLVSATRAAAKAHAGPITLEAFIDQIYQELAQLKQQQN
jgi:hypothetical protein